MGFWIFMLIMVVMLPIFMFAFGRSFRDNPPATINHTIGYRTKMSMKNMDTWKFAHHFFGDLWVKLGLLILIASIAVMLFVLNKETDIISKAGAAVLAIQLIILLVSIYPTEKALHKEFDDDGNHR